MGDIAGPRVWDCFTFYDEIEHLEARLELLRYQVDGFIVVEGTHTHQGDPKKLHLDGVTLPDNVIRCVADLGAYEEPWDREHAQRDFIGQYVRDMHNAFGDRLDDPPVVGRNGNFALDDILIVSDADEIPNPDAVKYLAAATEEGPAALAMRMFFYGLDWEDPGPDMPGPSVAWLHARALRVRDLPASLSELRLSHSEPGAKVKVFAGGGWHISYWGGPERRAAKLRAYAHAEQNNETTHALIATAHETGIGPNGEELVRVTDLEGVPEALVRRFG